jgi:hypothetical protein
MDFKKLVSKERQIWHRRLVPSIIAGVAVAIITLFFKFTASNIVLFSSLGASAAILTHDRIHRMNILRTVISSYFLALIISMIITWISNYFNLILPLQVLFVVTFSLLSLYMFNIFHPPAVAASLAFLIFEGTLIERSWIFMSVVILLIIIKVLTYMFYSDKLDLKKFLHLEFKKVK